MRRFRYLLAVLTVIVASCATGQKFEGDSVASPRLRNDTLALVRLHAAAGMDCERIERVEAQVLDVPAELKGNDDGVIVDGTITERWVASGCGRQHGYRVTFTPDGTGGSFIAVKPEP